jgi:hypothetical protein
MQGPAVRSHSLCSLCLCARRTSNATAHRRREHRVEGTAEDTEEVLTLRGRAYSFEGRACGGRGWREDSHLDANDRERAELRRQTDGLEVGRTRAGGVRSAVLLVSCGVG